MPRTGCKSCKESKLLLAIHTTSSFCSILLPSSLGLGFWSAAGVPITESHRHVDRSVSFSSIVSSAALRIS